jgi:hypothetical protein
LYANLSGRIDQSVILMDVYFYAIDESRLGIVLTPTCDFEQAKCEWVQLCALFDAWDVIGGLLRGAWSGKNLVDEKGAFISGPLSKGKANEFRDGLRILIGQQYQRYHWFAPLPGTEIPQIADFQLTTSIEVGELNLSSAVAELRSPYREEVAARYAAYMGRVGTDTPTPQDIDGIVTAATTHFFPAP